MRIFIRICESDTRALGISDRSKDKAAKFVFKVLHHGGNNYEDREVMSTSRQQHDGLGLHSCGGRFNRCEQFRTVQQLSVNSVATTFSWRRLVNSLRYCRRC